MMGQNSVAFDGPPSSVAIERPGDVENTAVRSAAIPSYRNHECFKPVTVIGMADDGGFRFGGHGVPQRSLRIERDMIGDKITPPWRKDID
ncbi:hypothetical protein [Sphingopyxis sp. EG6]|jgi:hypothetical protein|uniref:hypothetical protein n=1 Tax=Sphingopyxis sp. EG6 TaxID=1874061 RepID=UPI000DC62C5A|nr:hypothetical protein [Sphingopyxis sp. EG6]BBB08681.1 short-chain dehydrogenase/reductase [Sphingopyxis sp. EG6]